MSDERDELCGDSLAGHMQGLCACVAILDLRSQLAQAQAEIEDWRTKFQKALTP